MLDLKGKTVFSYENKNDHVTLVFDDGTHLCIWNTNYGLATSNSKQKPPKEKVLPWIKNEKEFLKKLPIKKKEKYKKAKKAFFWLLDNVQKVRDNYAYYSKDWHDIIPSFSMQIDMEADDPESILSIFFSSNVAPECDDWFKLRRERDWVRIVKMYNEVNKVSG